MNKRVCRMCGYVNSLHAELSLHSTNGEKAYLLIEIILKKWLEMLAASWAGMNKIYGAEAEVLEATASNPVLSGRDSHRHHQAPVVQLAEQRILKP